MVGLHTKWKIGIQKNKIKNEFSVDSIKEKKNWMIMQIFLEIP